MQKMQIRNMVFLFIITFTFYTSLDILQLPLPLYIEELGGGPDTIGWLMGVTGILTVILRPIMGVWSDLKGKKGILVFSMICWFLSPLLLLVGESFMWIAFVRVFKSIGLAGVVLATQALMAEQVDRKDRGKAIALQGIADGAAVIAGPIFGFWLVEHFGFKWMFSISSAVALIGVILTFYVKEKGEDQTLNEQALNNEFKESWISLAKKPILYIPTIIGFGQAFCFGAVLYFMAVFTSELGITNKGYLFAFWGVFLIIGRLIAGRVSDKYGRELIIIPTILLTAVGMYIVALFPTGFFIYLACALIGMGFGGGHTGLMAFTVDNCSNSNRGFNISFLGSSFEMGIAISGFTLGIIADTLSYNVAYFTAGTVVLVLGLGSWLFYKIILESAKNTGVINFE
jgi:MFS family permease